jgi:hypothetical protein
MMMMMMMKVAYSVNILSMYFRKLSSTTLALRIFISKFFQ